MEPLTGKLRRAAACRPATRQRKRQQQEEGGGSDTESCASAAAARPAAVKRSRGGADAASALAGPMCAADLCLYVRWHSACGAVRVNRLPLDPISGVGDLQGLFRDLVEAAFAPGQLPDYLTSEAFYKFSPSEELTTLPGDVARTEFRLAATLAGGWEYTLCERTLPGPADPDRRLLVTLAEFESDAVVVGGHRYVARLLTYPTISVSRDFLEGALAGLASLSEAEASAGGSRALAAGEEGEGGESAEAVAAAAPASRPASPCASIA